MKKNRLFAGAMALVMTAVTAISPMSLRSVTAAEVTDKPNFDFKVTGNYTEKKLSGADMTAIAEAFHYDQAATAVYVCDADAKGYIDWSNSAVESWQVYYTEVFQPVLSRDETGNLVVGKDENGKVQQAWSTYAAYPTETAGVITHEKELFCFQGDSGNNMIPGTVDIYYGNTYDKTNEELNQGQVYFEDVVTDTYIQVGVNIYDFVLSENHFCLSTECDKHIQTINSHLGLTELTTWRVTETTEGYVFGESFEFYLPEQTQITDAYVIRLYYTADDIPLNWMQRELLASVASMAIGDVEAIDVYGISHGKVFDESGMVNFNSSIGTRDRHLRAADFWILPEGVDTVLTLEDISGDDTNTPGNDTNVPGNDNTSNDNSNDNNTPNDTTTPPHVVDFSNAESQTVSKEDFAAILEANKESDIVIKSNNGVTFTFAKGTMAEVDGKESYDFSTSINNTYEESMPSYIQRNSFVSQINFHYSGQLPAMASIRFCVGTAYAGQTLYYSLMNENNTFSVVNAYVVDAEGYMTVQQNHCSSYVVTTAEPVQENDNGNNENNNDDNNNENSNDNANVTSPKTGDMNVIFSMAVVLAVGFGAVVIARKKRKTA